MTENRGQKTVALLRLRRLFMKSVAQRGMPLFSPWFEHQSCD
jgi:hypothetical protein